MSTATLAELFQAYETWQLDRARLSEQEGEGNYPHADEWHGSDDTAVELLERFVTAVSEVANLIGEAFTSHTAGDIGPHLTCSEAETLNAALIALGLHGPAEYLRIGHADGDDDEADEHHGGWS